MTSIWYKAKHSKKRNRKHLNKYKSNVVGTTMSAVICCVVGISLINIGVPWGVIPQTSPYAQNTGTSTSASSSAENPAVGSNSGVTQKTPSAPQNSPTLDSENDASPAAVTSFANLPADSYVANTILVPVSSMQDAQSTLSTLNDLGYSANTTIDPNDVSAGFIEIELADNANPGIVSDALNAQGIVAQPNFYYYLTDEEEGRDEGEDIAPGGSSSTSSSTKTDATDNSANSVAANTAGVGEGSGTPATLSSIIEGTANGESGAPAGQSLDTSLLAMDDDGEEESSPNLVERSLSVQAATINDPNADKNTDWLTTVDAFGAWSQLGYNTASDANPIGIAVIDSGCNANHEDLKDNIVGMYDTKTGGTSASDITDDKNHGTHVAGIIAAKANNDKGIAGVSYNAGLYIIRAMHLTGGSYIAESTDVLKAYQKIFDNRAKHNIRVVNMSLGTKRDGSLSANDTLVMNKINEAYSDYSILTVVAAGNSSDGTVPYKCYLCDFSDTLLGVINLQKDSSGNITRYSGSNYNLAGERTKDLGAPGGSNGSSVLSTVSNGGYNGMYGTSMASPVAAGIAALVFAANSSLSPAQASSVIYSSATDLSTSGFDVYTGYGCINANKAVQMAKDSKYITGADSMTKGSSIALSCSGARNWHSDNTAVATVNANGIVTGRDGGYASISADCGNERVTKTIVVYDASISGKSTVDQGSKSTYEVSCKPNGIWTFSSSNMSVATITETGTLEAKSAGTTTITATLSSNKNVKVSKDVTVPAPSKTGVKMYRLYNPNSGEHFYTKDTSERSTLINAGWRNEGEGWTAPESSSTPVFRLYNSAGGEHHYTMSADEKNGLVSAGWTYEGIGWYSDDAKSVPLYREYNPNAFANNHNYTTDVNEHNSLLALGWNDEGYAWYGI